MIRVEIRKHLNVVRPLRVHSGGMIERVMQRMIRRLQQENGNVTFESGRGVQTF